MNHLNKDDLPNINLNSMPEYFRVLGLDMHASAEEVTKAYKRLLNEWDPERFVSDPSARIKSEKKTAELDDAYSHIILYMKHPQYQYHPNSEDRSATKQRPSASTERTYREVEREGKKMTMRDRFSISAIKPVTALPNMLFIIYLTAILVLQIRRYEVFSWNLMPHIISGSLRFIIPPLVVCVIYNLLSGEAIKMKVLSLAVTAVFLLGIVPMDFGIYQELLGRTDAGINEETDDQKLVLQGEELKGKGKYSSAIKAFTKAITVNPANADAYYDRAIAYSMLNSDEKFISDCKEAARLGHLEAIKTLNRLDIRFQ